MILRCPAFWSAKWRPFHSPDTEPVYFAVPLFIPFQSEFVLSVFVEDRRQKPFNVEPDFQVQEFQFVRNGYFCVDNKDSEQGKPIFNRIVSLKSSFKLQK